MAGDQALKSREEINTERAHWSFGRLLGWHLLRGTRPDGRIDHAGRKWSNKAFAEATGLTDRTVRYWLQDQHLPADTETIERILFGSEEGFAEWRLELRYAHNRSGTGQISLAGDQSPADQTVAVTPSFSELPEKPPSIEPRATVGSVSARSPNRIGSPPRLSIAVLPFTNLSEDPDQQFVADGITDDLTTDLSRIAGMFVISRNTAFTYRDRSIGTREIGVELGVRYLLEGSARRSGTRLRVTAQLIDTDTDAHLWAERFDQEFGALLDVQSEITGRLVNTLKLELLEAEASHPADPSNVLDCILRGRAMMMRPKSAGRYAEAIDYFGRALVLNPQSVEACGLLALGLASRVSDQMSDCVPADIERATGLIQRTLAASPRNASAHLARGLLFDSQSRFDEATHEFETALQSNRNWASVVALLGKCKLLTGFFDEAVLLQERAILLSPRDPYIGLFYFRIGVARLLQSHLGEAITWFEKAILANEDHPLPHAWLAAACALAGLTERGGAELMKARMLTRGNQYSSIARLKTIGHRPPKIREVIEATFIAGLRLAGVPEA